MRSARRRRLSPAALSLAAPCALGCASYGAHLSATPLSPGASELSLSADALLIDRGFGPQLLPNPEVGWRRGVTEDVDVGGRVNVGSVELNARVRWWRLDGLHLAVVPGVGFGFVPVTNADVGLFNLNGFGALLAGVDLSARSQLVFGARGIARYAFPLTAFRGEASSAKLLYRIGGVLGLRLPVGETTYLFPDVSVLAPYDSERAEWGSPTLQGGVSLHFE